MLPEKLICDNANLQQKTTTEQNDFQALTEKRQRMVKELVSFVVEQLSANTLDDLHQKEEPTTE